MNEISTVLIKKLSQTLRNHQYSLQTIIGMYLSYYGGDAKSF